MTSKTQSTQPTLTIASIIVIIMLLIVAVTIVYALASSGSLLGEIIALIIAGGAFGFFIYLAIHHLRAETHQRP